MNYCSNINRFSNLKHVWNTMRIFKNSKISINWNKWQLKNRKEVILESIEELAPPWAPDCKIYIKEDNSLIKNHLNNDIIQEELKRAIKMIKRNSSPGLDGIDYEMIKRFPEEIKDIYLELLNMIWNKAKLPTTWKKYQITFIDKPNKEEVRPIPLSSCMGRIMERIINERLIWWAEHNNILDPDQNGFRRGRSYGDNLLKITTDIRVHIAKDEYVLTAFLDVSSAYDNVKYNTLITKLIEKNVQQN